LLTLLNEFGLLLLAACASTRETETESTRKARRITAVVAFMGAIISQSRSPEIFDVSVERWTEIQECQMLIVIAATILENSAG
jgi:hypothetical protein